jgi:hypothetical protein
LEVSQVNQFPPKQTMSVRLTPINQAGKEDAEGVEMANKTFAAIVAVGIQYNVPIDWNGCHDGQKFPPEVLRQCADRIEQLQLFPKSLRWLADNGGAELT